MIFLGICLIVGLLILQDILLFYFLQRRFKNFYHEIPDEKLPEISILIPARNEEEVLSDCLTALEQLDYPNGKMEIIVGDDQSEDSTAEILKHWVAKSPNRIFLDIRPVYPHINGKANALAQMVQVSKGELLLFTDADCQVNPKWVKEMVKAYRPSFGLVVGVTRVKSNVLFNRLQGMDWWLTLGMIKVSADLGVLLTAVGNNMLVSREAYEAVGGYENLAFSVTEDFALGQAIIAKGYRPVHQLTKNSLIDTKAEKSFLQLMRQRKRWMKGALSLKWHWQVLLVLQALFFPAVLGAIYFDIWIGGVLWTIKVIVQSGFILALSKKVKLKIPLWELFIFELYYLVISWSTIVYYFWPSKINWKKRKY